MWTFEEREEESGFSNRAPIFWLDLLHNEFFVLQQKVKEANNNSSNQVQSVNSITDNRYCLSDIHRFSGVIPPALWQRTNSAQFRISTLHTFTKSKKCIVISVSDELKKIEVNWTIVTNFITSNFIYAGLSGFHKSFDKTEEFLQLLLLHISALYYLTEIDSNVDPKKDGFDYSHKPHLSDSFKASKLQKYNREIIREEPIMKTSSTTSNENHSNNNKKAKSRSFLSSMKSRNNLPFFSNISPEKPTNDFGFGIFAIDEPLIKHHHCLIISPTQNGLKNQENQNTENQKHSVLVGTMYITESFLCYSSRSPFDLKLKLPFISIEKIEILEKFQSFKNILIIRHSNIEYRFVGVKNAIELSSTLSQLRHSILTKQLSLLHEKILPQNPPPSILRWFSRKGKSNDYSICKTPIFNFPFSLYSPTSNNIDDSVSISLIINDSPNLQGSLYLFPSLSIFISSEQNILVNFVYKNISHIIENNQFFEVIVQMSDISSQFILKFPNAHFISLFIDQWVSIKKNEEDSHFAGFSIVPSTENIDKKDFFSHLPEDELYLKKLWYLFYNVQGFDIRTSLFRNIIRSGIPNHLRAKIWHITSGVCYKQIDSSYEIPYRYLVDSYEHKHSLATEEILRDVERSLPEHSYYQSEEGLNALKRVLTAFSWRNTAIGYCQSMNVIAAFLLLYMSEEETYQMLCVICEDLLQNYYTQSMEGSLIDQQILRSLLEHYLPSVSAHFAVLDVPIAVITLPWFLCIFIRIIPWPASLRVLDVFFSEGRKILFQISLAIFRMFEDDILKSKEGIEVILLMKSRLDEVDADKLMKIAFGEFGELSSEQIDKLYHLHKPLILKEIRQNQLIELQHIKRADHSNSSEKLDTSPHNHIQPISNDTSPKKERTFWLISKAFQLRQTNEDSIQNVLSNIQKLHGSSLIQEIDSDLLENDAFL